MSELNSPFWMNPMMRAALKEHFVPRVHALGFKGPMPNFRRVAGDKMQFLRVEFSSWGGTYVVRLAACPMQGIYTDDGDHRPASKLTAADFNSPQSCYLTPSDDYAGWQFDYDKTGVVVEEFVVRLAIETADMLEARHAVLFDRLDHLDYERSQRKRLGRNPGR
jgi:hypothetical protein